MKKTTAEIRERLAEMANALTFDYHGKRCGVDPYYDTICCFDMWFGNEIDVTLYNLDDVMNTPLFDGKSLNEIAEEIEVDEF